ncbi:MAG: PEP-CTERM sorting domain-containing protein [Sedimentisphaerales bacterium]
MKKLLILMLVLGLASAANAAVSLSIDGVNATDGTEDILEGSTITLSVLSNDANPWMMEVTVLMADATLGTPAFTTAAGSMAGYNDWSGEGLWIYEISTGGTDPDYPTPGEQWTMDLTTLGALGSHFNVDIGPYGAQPVSSIDFTVVPEPMTIALLGFGALALLRRRK